MHGCTDSLCIAEIENIERSKTLKNYKIDADRINFSDPIFTEIRSEYPDFDKWAQKVSADKLRREAHCIKLAADSVPYCGIAILKWGEGVDGDAESGLKISTFKVAPEKTGAGIADKLLSSILVAAAERNITSIFVTFFDHHIKIAGYLEARGFRRISKRTELGESVYVLDLQNERRIFSGINQVAYEMLTPQYANRAKSPGPNQETPEYLAGLVANRIEKPIHRILELGPGAGRVLQEFSKLAKEVVAIEISPSMADLAQKTAPMSTILVANALDVSFPDHTFDGIYAGAFIHLFPSLDGARLVKNISRWIKPNGVVFISTTLSEDNDGDIEVKRDYKGNVVRYRVKWTEEKFREFVQTNGLDIEDSTYTHETERGKVWVGLICRPKISAEG